MPDPDLNTQLNTLANYSISLGQHLNNWKLGGLGFVTYWPYLGYRKFHEVQGHLKDRTGGGLNAGPIFRI